MTYNVFGGTLNLAQLQLPAHFTPSFVVSTLSSSKLMSENEEEEIAK